MKKIIAFLGLTLATVWQMPLVKANEGGEAKPAAPAAAHGGGGGAGEVAAIKPWAETQARMYVYKGQRQQMIGEMKKIVEEKKHLKMGSAEMTAKAKELVALHKQYAEATEEYNKLLFALKYRYPERLMKADMKSQHHEEVVPLEELETQLDLDSRLTQVMERAREQYPAPEGSADRKPSSVEGSASPEKPSLLDLPPILLRK